MVLLPSGLALVDNIPGLKQRLQEQSIRQTLPKQWQPNTSLAIGRINGLATVLQAKGKYTRIVNIADASA